MYYKIIIILLLQLIIIKIGYSINEPEGEGQKDKFLVIDNKYYDGRIYFFTDISACGILNDNIIFYENNLKDYKIEYVIFMNRLNQALAEQVKNEYGWKSKVIGDEFGLYKAYYNIKLQPWIIVLNNQGELILEGKLGGGSVNLKKIKGEIDKYKSNIGSSKYRNELIEVKRIPLQYNDKPLIGSLFREVLYDKSRGHFYLINNRSCNIYKLDTNGVVLNFINRNKQIDRICEIQWDNLTWAYYDSLVFLYFGTNDIKYMFHFYDIVNEKFSQPVEIKLKKFRSDNKPNFRSQYLTGFNKFLMFWDITGEINTKMEPDEPVISVYDNDGNFMKAFDTPDSIYLNYKISQWFNLYTCQNKYGELLSIQNFSDKLKIWDSNQNLKKVLNVNYSNFRKIDFDFKDTLSSLDAAQLKSRISRINVVLYDNTNDVVLISYSNETYPEGVIDYLSPEVKRQIFYHICDRNGKKLFDKDIELTNHNIPFYFDNHHIYCTEVNNNVLEIVVYKINKTL